MLAAFLLLPLAGGLLTAFLPESRKGEARWIALFFTTLAFLISVIMYVMYDNTAGGLQYVETTEWISTDLFTLSFGLGIDGLSAPMILLLGLLSVVSVLISWNISEKTGQYFSWLLLLESAVAGVFLSLDLIQFFLFWELELLPMFMLISRWGTGRKLYSATKFLLYTLAGSALMLAGFLLLGAAGGSFDIQTLTDSPVTDAAIPLGLIFWSIMLAFLVKLPIFPVHTWLPDAHTDAPTAVSVMLAGVLLKMGGYGILRIAVPLLPEVAYDSQTILATLAGISIIWGGVITLRQTDLKRLIAYSSVSHMGYVLLGISAMNSVGFSGAAFQMFTHGTITGLLFVMVGYVYERTHTRQISEMSGLMHYLPKGGIIMVIAGLASLGLPGLSGFVAELAVFLGALEPHPVATILGILGVVLSSGYILWTLQRVFQGPPRKEWQHLRDSTAWYEWLAIAALLIPIILFGVYPALLAESIESGILPIAQVMEALEELV